MAAGVWRPKGPMKPPSREQIAEILKMVNARKPQASHGKKTTGSKKAAKKASKKASKPRRKRTSHGLEDGVYVEEIPSTPTPPPESKKKVKYVGRYRYLIKKRFKKRALKGKPPMDFEDYVRKFFAKHSQGSFHLDLKEDKAEKRHKKEKRIKEMQRALAEALSRPSAPNKARAFLPLEGDL